MRNAIHLYRAKGKRKEKNCSRSAVENARLQTRIVTIAIIYLVVLVCSASVIGTVTVTVEELFANVCECASVVLAVAATADIFCLRSTYRRLDVPRQRRQWPMRRSNDSIGLIAVSLLPESRRLRHTNDKRNRIFFSSAIECVCVCYVSVCLCASVLRLFSMWSTQLTSIHLQQQIWIRTSKISMKNTFSNFCRFVYARWLCKCVSDERRRVPFFQLCFKITICCFLLQTLAATTK